VTYQPTANFSVVDLYRMVRTKGFAEGLTQGLLDRSCMYGACGSIPTQPAVRSSGVTTGKWLPHIGARWEFSLHPTLSYDVIALPNSK
jgi:hypothetical protein